MLRVTAVQVSTFRFRIAEQRLRLHAYPHVLRTPEPAKITQSSTLCGGPHALRFGHDTAFP